MITNEMKSGIELIAEERQEQLTKHGRTVLKDLEHNKDCQLSYAAYRLIHGVGHIDCNYPPKGWDKGIWDRMLNKPRKERLVIAAALLAAEIDRESAEEAFKNANPL